MIIGVISVSCTGRFKDLNTDKTGITDENMQVDLNHLGIPLDVIQQGIYFNYDYGKGKNWPYQLMQNLSADMFSGYMHDYKPLNGGSHNSDYNLQDGWNGTLWENTYAYIMPQIKRLEDSTRLKYPAVYAVTEILKVEVSIGFPITMVLLFTRVSEIKNDLSAGYPTGCLSLFPG